ncbi:MAG: hypothetical protein KC983_12705 [Phycisphaerales bacterium]|nr:hypothetical protein [Phycisphaerales bacterium]
MSRMPAYSPRLAALTRLLVWTAIAICAGIIVFAILQVFIPKFIEYLTWLMVFGLAIPYLVGIAMCMSLASLDIWRRMMILGSFVGAAAYIAHITSILLGGRARLLPVAVTLALGLGVFFVWCVVASVLLRVRLKSRFARRSVATTLVLLAIAFVTVAATGQRILLAETSRGRFHWEQRLDVAIGVFTVSVVVLIVALGAILYEQGVLGPVRESLRDDLACDCPRCRRRFEFKSHGAHCPTCGLKIRVIPS